MRGCHVFHRLAIPLLIAASLSAQAVVNGPFIMFIGPPGSGKSTQAAKTGEELKIPVLRAEDLIASDPAAFAKNAPGITGIEPRTDPAMNRVFSSAISSGKYQNGLIVDGYPATKDHGDYLRNLVVAGNVPAPVIVRLEITDDQLRKRLGKKADSRFEQLLKDYHREMDMMDVYFPGSLVIRVPADGKPGQVADRIRKALAGSPVNTRS